MKFYETTNFQNNSEQLLVPENFCNKLSVFLVVSSCDVLPFFLLFTDLAYTHVYFYREKVQKRKRENSGNMECQFQLRFKLANCNQLENDLYIGFII